MLSDIYNLIFEIISFPFRVGVNVLTQSVSLCEGHVTSCSIALSLVVVVLLILAITELLRWKMRTFDPAAEIMLPRSRHVGFLTRCFYTLFASDPEIVMLCAWRDRAKRAALGWFLVVTTSLAFFSALVLSETIAEAEDGFSDSAPLMFAIVFSIFIFAFDRVMIMSEYNRGIVVIRLIISVVVAFFVGSSVAVWVFSATIDRYRLEYQQASAVPQRGAMVAAGHGGAAAAQAGGIGPAAQTERLQSLLKETEKEQATLRADIQRNREKADESEVEKGLVARTLQDVVNMRCLLVNMQAEVERGTARGFPCPNFQHLVRDVVRPSGSAGMGKNYLLFSNAVVRLYNEREDNLPELPAISEAFLRLPLATAVAPNPAEVKNALERTDRLRDALAVYEQDLSVRLQTLANERRDIESRLDQIRAELRDYRGRIAEAVAANNREREKVEEMFYSDIVARHVTMFIIIGEDPIGRGFLMLVFIVLLFVMDLSVVLAKLALKTPQYNRLCEKHEEHATEDAVKYLENFKIRMRQDAPEGP